MGRLVEVMRNLIATIINDRIQQSITLHNSLHVFCYMSGLVTTIKEENIHHKLVTLQQPPLKQINLDTRKAYNALDQGEMVKNMRGYKFGPQASTVATGDRKSVV